MAAYMASLAKLLERDEAVYWPGHGGPVRNPPRFVRALLQHRRQREAAILDRLAAGDRTIREIVPSSTPASRPRCTARRGCPSSRIWRTSSAGGSSRATARRRWTHTIARPDSCTPPKRMAYLSNSP